MDQDGANLNYLQSRSELVLTPRFSPVIESGGAGGDDLRMVITYLSYEKRVPHIYLLDIHSGRRELLGNFPNMTFAPTFPRMAVP